MVGDRLKDWFEEHPGEGKDIVMKSTQAARLSAWLDGVRVRTVYPSPAMKAAR